MRQQQRQRPRGRGRKSSNPLSRNYESNGPDVKIRGNAGHIAEKYSVLARDSLTSGDRVMAENYFQHAEHYYRIVASAQPAGGREKPAVENNAENGEGPQPSLERVPEEVLAKTATPAESEAKGADADGNSEPKPAPRNSRSRANGNRRTSRRDNSAKSSESNDADSLSDDAASLPSSLIGGGDDVKTQSASGDE